MNDPTSDDPVTSSANQPNAARAVSKHHPSPPVPQYLTEETVSRMTTLSRTGLQAMRSRGEGPPYARLGHRIVYRLADVERWIEARTRRGDNER